MTDSELIKIVPSSRQFNFQQLEFYAFIHFTVNTFTDKEWGNGDESPEIFNPAKLDALQWVRTIAEAGMKGLILTCKHHDGFCLWPSRYTDHSVASSPYREGKGDIVREVSEACRKYGIRFGVYLSPWDRNNKLYGSGKAYDDYFAAQLTELLTGYGDIFSVWFDGACGEGPDGRKQYYDWDRYYNTVRELQPNACISVCGPDIRWCGNEAGYTRKAEWSVVPERAKDSEKVSEKSQTADDEEFRTRHVDARDEDLGSREILRDETNLIWYPAEVNTSIRPGWFYHSSEDNQVRSPEELYRIYLNSVGGNAMFLLNIPPTPEGLIHENDIECLKQLKKKIDDTFRNNLLDSARISGTGDGIEGVRKDDYESCFYGSKGAETVIEAEWDAPRAVGALVIKEDIRFSQRVEQFRIEASCRGEMKEVYRGTVIGYKKIVPDIAVKTDKVRIIIEDSRCEPIISFLGIYQSIKGEEQV